MCPSSPYCSLSPGALNVAFCTVCSIQSSMHSFQFSWWHSWQVVLKISHLESRLLGYCNKCKLQSYHQISLPPNLKTSHGSSIRSISNKPDLRWNSNSISTCKLQLNSLFCAAYFKIQACFEPWTLSSNYSQVSCRHVQHSCWGFSTCCLWALVHISMTHNTLACTTKSCASVLVNWNPFEGS